MNEKQTTTKPAPPWVFFTFVMAFAAYYAHDVWGGRFETIAYGFLCILILGVLGLLLIISAVRQRRRSELNVKYASPQAAGLKKIVRPFLLILILTGYAALQATVGFMAATFLAFLCLVRLFGEQRRIYLLATAIGMTVLTYITFVQLLSIPVPEGALFG